MLDTETVLIPSPAAEVGPAKPKITVRKPALDETAS
jgi:hypothetical protein